MDSSRHLEVLNERGHSLLATAEGHLDQQVPACPDWKVVDLVGHIGSAWAWAAETVRTRQRAQFPLPPDGASPSQVVTWSHAQLAASCEVLGGADFDADCWTFGLPRSAARFWARRQALESALHAHDVEEAVSGTPAPLDPEVARDGVDEFLTVMLPRFFRDNPGEWAGESFHLHRTDGDGEWITRLGPEGKVETERTHAKGDVAVRGPAEALWLWTTGRLGAAHADALDIVGDRALFDRWTATVTF